MIDIASILKSLDDIVLLIDSDLIFRNYWVANEASLWVSPSQFLDKNIQEVFPNDLDVDVSHKIRNAFQTQKNDRVIYSSPKENSRKWYRVKLNLIDDLDEFGQQYMLLIIGDCTEEMEIKEQKRIFEESIAQNWDAIRFSDLNEVIQYVNPATNRLYGYQGDELIGQHVSIFNSQRGVTTAEITTSVKQNGIWTGELLQVKKDKSLVETFLSVQVIKDIDDKPMGYVSQSKSISSQKETANKLKQIIEEKELLLKELSVFENIVSQNWDAITFANLKGDIQYINLAANRLYGYEGVELIGQNVDIFNSQQEHDTREIIQAIISTGMWAGEIVQVRKDQTTFNAFLSVQLIKDSLGEPIGYTSHSKDISGEKETANKLKKIIRERETLLKEIHHRVKNNLQVITSLLSLQANTINNKKIKNIFQQSQYRINAMATIHETLYQSDDLLKIGYAQYMKDLAHYLVLSIKGSNHEIELSINAINVRLNIDTAIPLGLLINEIITNALKYGIEDGKSGEIYIDLILTEYPHYLLKIGDNGIGFSREINFKTTNSLGLKLIHNLAHQLKGSVSRNLSKKGTHYEIDFQEIIQ